jgi:hypothetical protein
MFYIHQTSCITAQRILADPSFTSITESKDNQLFATEDNYDSIPPNVLRRLGKAVKMGIATGNEVLSNNVVDGIILGTAHGGLEDCIKFLNQIIQYQEGRLTPTNFVQSTTNAIAGQLGIMYKNKGYNITHVHRGLAFENALIDVEMLLNEHSTNTYMVGGVDEISEYNYTIEDLAGSYKKEIISNTQLLESTTDGTIAGEGAAMFIVNTLKNNATAAVRAIKTFVTKKENTLQEQLSSFLNTALPTGESIDLIISGRNGDARLNTYYESVEDSLKGVQTSYYKHLTGELPTSSALALWLASKALNTQELNSLLKINTAKPLKNILLYNNYKGSQHSFILVSAV